MVFGKTGEIMSQDAILQHIQDNPGVLQSNVYKNLGMPKSTVSIQVKKLLKWNQIKRTPTEDRQTFMLYVK